MSEEMVKMVGELLPVFGSLLMAVLSYACVRLTAYINTKIKVKSVANVLGRLTDTAYSVVREVQQVYLSELKKASGWEDHQRGIRCREGDGCGQG